MLIGKLRHKAERESKEEALKDSKLSHYTSKTMDEPLESTGGGYAAKRTNDIPQAPPRKPTRAKSNRRSNSSCPHTSTIGDKCVVNCRECGVFFPKVSLI